ncbi:MAG: DNA polymerase I [Candidatus Omnitrophica bacterium]|nr:DNA polymerase I [Candidatus Omnitrophota bacterium]MCM8807363.1 DNA polymerase I [Candidatus Omnitrophota bacterium]
MKNIVYLIDGTGIAYRCFYALPELKTTTGILTNAIYGFTSVLLKILKEKNPEYIAVFFDLAVPTFRHKTFEKYKEKRKPMPDELSGQINKIKEIIKCFGIKYIEKEGFESDDLISSYVEKLKGLNCEIYIVTSDKDIFQLISENVFIINPVNYEIIDKKKFLEKYGFEPSKIVDFIALAGDASDNIPGVPGIGEKTASLLLLKYSSLEEIYENLEKIEPRSLREKLEKNKDKAFLSKELAKLNREIFDEIKLENIKRNEPDIIKLVELFEMFEFKKFKDVLKEIYKGIETLENLENYIGFSTGEILEYGKIKRNKDFYKEVLENEKIGKIGFDMKDKIIELKKEGIYLKNVEFDFSIARHLTGKFIYEKDLFKLKEKYEKLLSEFEMEKLFRDVEMPLIDVLVWMETNGIKVDREYLKELEKKIDKEIDEIKEKIFSLAGDVFNLNSPTQICEILYEKLKLPVIKKTKTAYSTETSVLKELASLHPLPQYLLQYRELYKIKSTYIEGILEYVDEKTGRIYPTFSQVSTSTGRLTCSNPNLQNLPIRTQTGSLIRKGFCSEGENILYSFDYSQIELRVLAHFSEDPVLIESFEKDKDIHEETGELIFSFDSLFSPVNLKELSKEEKRRLAKTINFGIIYGMSAHGLSQELGIPIEESSYFIKKYFERFKKVKEYIDEIVKKAEEKGYVETLMKRRRYIPEIRSSNKNEREFGKRVAINMPIQGTAAEIIKMAMNNIYKKFKEEKLKSKLLLQIHDELLFEVTPDEEEKVRKYVKEIMKNVVILKVPLKVDVKRGKNFLEMEEIYD